MYIYLFYIVKANDCESFDPLNPDHMAEIGDDATTLAHLLQVRKYQILVLHHLLIQVTLSFTFPEQCLNFIQNYVYQDYGGNNIEICTHKDGDRAVFTSLWALGAWAVKSTALITGAIYFPDLMNSWLG